MKIEIRTELKINVKKIVTDCTLNVSEEELRSEIKGIVKLWAEQRLKESGWPVPIDTEEIRTYLIENDIILENETAELVDPNEAEAHPLK